MIKFLWERIKARWVHPPVLDITDWDLKDALEQILFHFKNHGDLLLYWYEDDSGFYVKSRPGNILVLDTPEGSIQVTFMDGIHFVGRRFDDSYMHSITVPTSNVELLHDVLVFHFTDAYCKIVDPVLRA